jgi:signal transduction histidine kinase
MTLLFKIILAFVLLVLFLIYKIIRLYSKSKRIEYEFTSIVNHSFRTPLTKISWFSKELEKDLSINEKALLIQNLNNTNNRLLEIVDLILGIKNINNTSSYFFQAISIQDILEKSIAKYREEINKKNITFNFSSFKEIPLLTMDLNKISFVIDTVLENAILYTSNQGKISITSSFNSRNLILVINDTGMGLNFKEKLRIFFKFYRSKRAILIHPDGMGLKLYLAKQIIKRHGGKILASSNGINKGTTIQIVLPFSKKLL